MKLFLLDAGGAGLFFLFIGLGVIFIFLAILAEAGIMLMMKYQSFFKKSLIDSLLANVISLLAGFLLLQYFDDLGYYTIPSMAILYAITVVIETVLLQLRNKEKPLGTTVAVSIVMNLFTYFILYLISNS